MNTNLVNRKKIFEFGTKAETLETLRDIITSASIQDLYYFSVGEWKKDSPAVIHLIQEKFASKKVIVRSSAQGEDSHGQSMAGAYQSVLNIDVNDADVLTGAIQQVVQSYDGDIKDQVLIQAMVEDVAVSGVIMTRDLQDGAPYYVINYDDNSGRTDSVTGGVGVHKTVYINHDFKKEYIGSERIRKIIKLAQELDSLCGTIGLDIEFGMKTDEKLFLFQVRPITLSQGWSKDIEEDVRRTLAAAQGVIEQQDVPQHGIVGQNTILTTMSDWNPAEMIGVIPQPLAMSLYQELITDRVWSVAREQLGYRSVPFPLMVNIFGRTYIDVRHSFNSFLPASLDSCIADKVVTAWLDHLAKNPQLHDKVEFEVAQTCFDFCFDGHASQDILIVLDDEEKSIFKKELVAITRKCLQTGADSSLNKALNQIEKLNQIQMLYPSNEDVHRLLQDCKDLGTLSFSIIARHAFIAEALLRSAVVRGAITEDRLKMFRRSITTVTGQLAEDMNLLASGEIKLDEFLKVYGHLRPGTYDITSLRYVDRQNLFKDIKIKEPTNVEAFQLSNAETSRFQRLLNESGFDHISVPDFFDYCRSSIMGREYGKFVFTKNISMLLESLAEWGESRRFSREDMSYLTLNDIFESKNTFDMLSEIITQNRVERKMSEKLKFSHIIRGTKDIYVVPVRRSAPNFISTMKIEGQVAVLDSYSTESIEGKIVCIENADPGFDWIFTKKIKALITKYGGANSHMAIRCAEFGLPAAIGCGEETFERVLGEGYVELNCAEESIRPLHVRHT